MHTDTHTHTHTHTHTQDVIMGGSVCTAIAQMWLLSVTVFLVSLVLLYFEDKIDGASSVMTEFSLEKFVDLSRRNALFCLAVNI